MVLFAGQRVTATRMNILANTLAKTKRTANSPTMTTVETITDTVTANVVAGEEYKIVWSGAVFSSVANDVARVRIREDNVAGAELQLRQKPIPLGGSQAVELYVETFWTAVATEAQPFVFTMVRNTGTGTLGAQAAATTPTFFYVEHA